ncbi:MAG: AAA family ATPase [Thermoanaerobaculia bacterium]
MPVRIFIQVPLGEDAKALERVIHPLLDERPGNWFVSVVEPQTSPDWHVRIEGPGGFVWSRRFSGPDEVDPAFIGHAISDAFSSRRLTIGAISVEGFGPFRETLLAFDSLAVLVGANGSGKTSVFELLRAIRDFARSEIPPEIIPGWEIREVFHRPGPDRLRFMIALKSEAEAFLFEAEIIGPVGTPSISSERLSVGLNNLDEKPYAQLHRTKEGGSLYDLGEIATEIHAPRANQLAFMSYVNPGHPTLYRLKEHVDGWRFFSGIRFNEHLLRRPALVEEAPTFLRDDGGNLASVLHWLQNEHPAVFSEIQLHIRGVIPAFRSLSVRSTGAGRVTLMWDEQGLVNPLSAADLSDGSLRLLLWVTLSLTPTPPPLVCIDEPEVGMHPRTLPLIAALMKKLSERTQVLVTTHSSYLLAHFDVATVGVLHKRNGSIEYLRPSSSKALTESLREFGAEELELMHRSDELEALS